MKLKDLIERPDLKENKHLDAAYLQLGALISELSIKQLNDEMVHAINKEIEELNAISDSGKRLRSEIRKKQSGIITMLEKKLKIVTKGHYRNTWLAIGMAAFGIPLGVAFGASLGNMGYIGIGLPIGLVIGIAVGTKMDTKAVEEGRQLDIELKY